MLGAGFVVVLLLAARPAPGQLKLSTDKPAKVEEVRPKPSPEAKIADLEKRLENIEKQLKDLALVLKDLKKPAPRYQMLNAGDRVVILDTEKGTAQTIEPASKKAPRYQSFSVGRSVIVVDTAFGSITKTDGAK
jgi:hypothetical protein